MKTKEIGYEVFEVIRSKHTQGYINYHLRNYDERDLFDFYENPSYIKQRIFNEWYDWFVDNPCVDKLEVTCGSCFTFSIGAIYINPVTYEILGYFRITKDHNRLYLLK